jgi:Na+-translocating ferredoxin:NAD+ oxidoreductase RnfE subunit
MKKIIYKTFEALLILFSVFVLGIFIPLLVSSVIILTNDDVTATDCTTSGIFWFITFFGWLTSAVYINDEIKK